MAITSGTVSVTTAATALNVKGGFQYLYITNTDATNVLTIGPSTVTAGAGRTVAVSGGSIEVRVMPGDILYGISAGTIAVGVTIVGA